MYRIGKVTWFAAGGFAPLMDAPDAGTGGGGTDLVGGGDGTPPPTSDTDPATGTEPATARTPTDDDEDDDDPDLRADAEVTPERWKRVTAKLTKLNRRDRAFRVERARLRELREQGITLDDLIHGTRQHRELANTIANNPTLKKLVHGDVADEERRAPAAREPEPDPDFDESGLPFDPKDEANTFAVGLARDNHELKRLAKQLQTRLDAIEGKDTQRTQAEQQRAEAVEKTTWKSAIDAAAKTIADDDTRNLFKDALAAAYERRKDRKEGDRVIPGHGKSVQFFIAHYLKGRLAPGQAAAANAAVARVAPATPPVRTAATQQRIAESNKHLPRTVAPGGTPASARTGKQSLIDIRRKITGSNARF